MNRTILISLVVISMFTVSNLMACGADGNNAGANAANGAKTPTPGQTGQAGVTPPAAAKPVDNAGAKKTLSSEFLATAGGVVGGLGTAVALSPVTGVLGGAMAGIGVGKLITRALTPAKK